MRGVKFNKESMPSDFESAFLPHKTFRSSCFIGWKDQRKYGFLRRGSCSSTGSVSELVTDEGRGTGSQHLRQRP